jgi:hypothetical protein
VSNSLIRFLRHNFAAQAASDGVDDARLWKGEVGLERLEAFP